MQSSGFAERYSWKLIYLTTFISKRREREKKKAKQNEIAPRSYITEWNETRNKLSWNQPKKKKKIPISD